MVVCVLAFLFILLLLLQVADSDDGFEIKRSAWISTPARGAKIPRANIAPFAHTISKDKASAEEKKADTVRRVLPYDDGKDRGKNKNDKQGMYHKKKVRTSNDFVITLKKTGDCVRY